MEMQHSSSQDATPVLKQNKNSQSFHEAAASASSNQENNHFRSKLMSSLRDTFQKLKDEDAIVCEDFQQCLSNDSDSELDMHNRKNHRKKPGTSPSAYSAVFQDNPSPQQQRNRRTSYSYLNLLPEANPLRDKTMKEDTIKFQNIQSIFNLRQEEEFLRRGQIPQGEPLQIVIGEKTQQGKEKSSQNGVDQLNLSNSSSRSSLHQDKQGENEGESSDSQKPNQEETQQTNEDKKNKGQKQKIKKGDKKSLEVSNGDQVRLLKTLQNFISDEPDAIIAAAATAKDNSAAQKVNAKLIYKKQNQHMLVNLQNKVQVIKDTSASKKSIYSGEPTTNSRNENLIFDSKFESGNLASVYMLNEQKFNLLVQQDINTNGYTQWFYFKVKNKSKCSNVSFVIGNFYKKESLFQKGMKISVFSRAKMEQQDVGWYKGGTNIKYIPSTMHKGISQFSTYINGRHSYLLSFDFNFEYDNDETYFAYTVPYTYSQLQKYLYSIQQQNYNFYQLRPLCNSLLGNQLFLVTITNPITQLNQNLQKQAVFITARVHPGETVSSYVLEGLIDYLISDAPEANELREQFIFKIVPMLNPDGVIHGNYRCSLAGCDLNRRWRFPMKNVHPEIYYTKRAIYELNQNYPLVFYCDIHGHSKKKDFFLYGCDEKNDYYSVREFPFIISKLSSFFDFKSCDFRMYKMKDATSRQTIFRDLNVENIFTLETSFCGPSNAQIHFSLEDLKSIGVSLAKSLLCRFSKQKSDHLTRNNIVLEDIYELSQGNKNQEDGDSDGSDSQPSCDNLDEKDLVSLLPNDDNQANKKKKKRTPNQFQSRMLLTKYFSKSPVKEKKDERAHTEAKDSKLSRPITQMSSERRQPIMKTPQDIEMDISPKIYNFINTQSRKTPTKAQSGVYSIIQPTIFTSANPLIRDFNATPQSANILTKQKQIQLQNEQYQLQKAFIMYQQQVQQQKDVNQEQQRQNQEDAMRKMIEDIHQKGTFQPQNFKRRSETPQPNRYLSNNNTISKQDTQQQQRNYTSTLPDQDMMKQSDIINNPELLTYERRQYFSDVKQEMSDHSDYDLKQMQDTKGFQEMKGREAQSVTTAVAPVAVAVNRNQMKNSYMHFMNVNNKRNMMLGGNSGVQDMSYTGSFMSNSYKNRTNQFLTGYKSSSIQRYIQHHLEHVGVRRIKTVMNQNSSPSPHSQQLNRQGNSVVFNSDNKTSHTLRTDATQEQFRNPNNINLFSTEEIDLDQQNAVSEFDAVRMYHQQISKLKNSSSNNNYNNNSNMNVSSGFNNQSNKQYISPDRTNKLSESSQGLNQAFQNKKKNSGNANEVVYGRNSSVGHPRIKSNDHQHQQNEQSRKDIFQKKIKEQQNAQEYLYNFTNLASNNNLMNNSNSNQNNGNNSNSNQNSNQNNNYNNNINNNNGNVSYNNNNNNNNNNSNPNIFYHTSNNFNNINSQQNNNFNINSTQANNNNNNNMLNSTGNNYYEKGRAQNKEQSPFRLTSQDYVLSNFQIKSYQPNYMTSKQSILQQQKQTNQVMKKLNNNKSVIQQQEKNIIAQEQMINQKLKNKVDLVYSRKRSYTSINAKSDNKILN